MTFKTLTGAALTAVLLLSGPAFATDEYNVANGLTLNGNVLGMHGIDPTSMFGDRGPAIGDALYTSTHDGVDYYFATSDAQERFDSNPRAFLPQFGGFCAFGVYVGKKLDGDVRYADIVDGKLYLFVNAAILAKYRENPEAVIKGANAKWPGIVNTPVRDL